MKKGHYWVKVRGKVTTGKFDGKSWTLALSVWDKLVRWITNSKIEVLFDAPPECQTGCVCKQNADGTWDVKCA